MLISVCGGLTISSYFNQIWCMFFFFFFLILRTRADRQPLSRFQFIHFISIFFSSVRQSFICYKYGSVFFYLLMSSSSLTSSFSTEYQLAKMFRLPHLPAKRIHLDQFSVEKQNNNKNIIQINVIRDVIWLHLK